MSSAARTLRAAARPMARAANTQFTSSTAQQQRFFSQQLQQQFRARFRQQGQQQSSKGRRWQSTASEGQQQSWFKRAWESEVGIKTVHFWAPVMKWALVLAGISDFARPVEKLSLTQNFALTCTGLIWTRWCLIIKPKNYLLAAVNFFLGLVGLVQLGRIATHKPSTTEQVADAIEEVKEEIKDKVKA